MWKIATIGRGKHQKAWKQDNRREHNSNPLQLHSHVHAQSFQVDRNLGQRDSNLIGAAILNSVEWVALLSRRWPLRPLPQWRASFHLMNLRWDVDRMQLRYSHSLFDDLCKPRDCTNRCDTNEVEEPVPRALIWESLGAWISTWQVIKSVSSALAEWYSCVSSPNLIGGSLVESWVSESLASVCSKVRRVLYIDGQFLAMCPVLKQFKHGITTLQIFLNLYASICMQSECIAAIVVL